MRTRSGSSLIPLSLCSRHGSREPGGDLCKRRFHLPGLVADLCVGEAQARKARPGMGLVAEVVARLLRGSAVVAQAVGFDHEAEGRPVEVDAEAVDLRAREWRRKTRSASDREEAALELGVREKEGLAVESAAEDAEAGHARQLIQ